MNKKLKKLQFNFTNISQSKQLMKLGLPVDTADFIMYNDVMSGDMCMLQCPHFLTEHGMKSYTFTQAAKGYENIAIPSWSVGRLIEILIICLIPDKIEEYAKVVFSYSSLSKNQSQVKAYISIIKDYIEAGMIDFERLYES